MKNNQKAPEQILRDAFAHATPAGDLSAILAQCEKKERSLIVMTKANPKTRILRTVTAIAAAAALLIGGGVAIRAYEVNYRLDTTVLLDVNPSLEITANRKEKVLAVTPLNADAVEVIDDMELTGSSLDVAVNALVGSMLQKGYLDPGDGAILLSIEGRDEAKSAAIEGKLSEGLSVMLADQAAGVAVTAQSISPNADDKAVAAQFGVSVGKVEYIKRMQADFPTYTFDELLQMNIKDLWRLEAGLPIGNEIIQHIEGGLPIDEIKMWLFSYVEYWLKDRSIPFDREQITHLVMVPEVYYGDAYYHCTFEDANYSYSAYVNVYSGNAIRLNYYTYRYDMAMAEENTAALLARAKALAGVEIAPGSARFNFVNRTNHLVYDEEAIFVSFRAALDKAPYTYAFGAETGKLLNSWVGEEIKARNPVEPVAEFDKRGWITNESAIDIALHAVGLDHETATVSSTSGIGLSIHSGLESRTKVCFFDNAGRNYYEINVGNESGKPYLDSELWFDEVVCRTVRDDDHPLYRMKWLEQNSNPSTTHIMSYSPREMQIYKQALADAGTTEQDAVLVRMDMLQDYQENGRFELWIDFNANGSRYHYLYDMRNDDALIEKSVKPLDQVVEFQGDTVDYVNDEVLAAALADAGLTEAQIESPRVVNAAIQDVFCWKVEFKANGQQYTYYFDIFNDGALYKKTVTPIAS